MGLEQFEQRLERLVEGVFAKAFRGELQPVEVGRRLAREMDLRRTVAPRGFITPNEFEISLSPQDYERFGGLVDELGRELADLAREHARTEGYVFLGPVLCHVGVGEHLPKSTFTVTAAVVESDVPIAGWIIRADGSRLSVIKDEPITIGRLAENAIVITDPNVSRHHAEIRADAQEVVLVDLGSTNGTRVNGTNVERQVLKNGDVVTIGHTSFRFEAE